MIKNVRLDQIRSHFDILADDLSKWRQRNNFYHQQQAEYIRYLTGSGKRILELGCSNGDLLNALQPSYGVGIDISPRTITVAREKYPRLKFEIGDAGQIEKIVDADFDYIILTDLIGYVDDLQNFFDQLHRLCRPHTKVIVSCHNFLWQPVLRFGEKIGMKMATPEQSWLSLDDVRNLLYITDFQVVKTERRLLCPKFIPVVSWLLNHLGTLPGFSNASLSQYVVARPVHRDPTNELSTTIVIPCRNEKGNIEPAIQRLPMFGSRQEIIFVDGHSTDGTQDEIKRVIAKYPDKDIKFLAQDGTGKGDAVRKGFHDATGDILMILDADLTVPPEDLPKFYKTIASGKADFLNGCRLIYPMEDRAMRTLNLLGNKFFAMVFSWLLGQRLKDTLCGTKVLFRKDYQMIVANRAYFGDFDPFGDFDLLFGASKLNLKIIEIPVRYRDRTYGETKIHRFRHGFLLLRMVIYAYRKLKAI